MKIINKSQLFSNLNKKKSNKSLILNKKLFEISSIF